MWGGHSLRQAQGRLCPPSLTSQAQITSISEGQARVRENIKALKGSAEEKTLVERYARQLNQQEDQMESLHKQIADLQQRRNEAQKVLDSSVQQLSLEAKI
jgi:chromosome segregation ATPase